MSKRLRLRVQVKLKADTPREVIAALRGMACGVKVLDPSLTEHPFFACKGWQFLMLAGVSDRQPPYVERNGAACWMGFNAYVDNRDGRVHKFLDWLSDHVDSTEEHVMGEMQEDGGPCQLIGHVRRDQKPAYPAYGTGFRPPGFIL